MLDPKRLCFRGKPTKLKVGDIIRHFPRKRFVEFFRSKISNDSRLEFSDGNDNGNTVLIGDDTFSDALAYIIGASHGLSATKIDACSFEAHAYQFVSQTK